MSTATALQNNTTAQSQSVSSPSHPGLLLQRKCACGGATSAPLAGECEQCTKRRLQAKLTIGASNDPLEQEADRIADQIMTSPSHSTVSSVPLKVQRFTGSSSAQEMEAPASVERALAGLGQPLEPSLREDMEGRFGYDFSQVRVHTGNAAEQSARDVSAYAYTVGNNIVFGAGQYSPGSQNRRQLLVHELVHVVQQSDGRPLVQRDGDEDRLRQDFGTQVSDAYLSVELGEIPTRSVGMLLWRAQEYFNHMQEGGDSLLSGSQYAYLTLQIFLELSLRAEVAPRDPMDNALLTGPVGQVVDIFAVAAGTPWRANRPKTVEEISPFNNDMENVRETAMPEIERRSGVFEPDAHIATPGLSAMVEQRLARIETRLTEGVAEVENGETEAPLSSEWILSSMPSQTPTLIQETLPGSRVLEEGLQLLRESPYWDRIGEIWFLGRRLFFLDKEGHLQGAEDSSVRLQQRTGRGGTTFFVSLDTSAHTAAGMIQLGTESMVRGERDVVIVRPITVLSGMTPILNRRDRLAQTGRGVGIIVAPLFTRVTNTQEAIEYLIEAMGRAIRIMPWAIYQTAVNMMENPRSALLEVALELGIEYISRRAPVIGQAVQGVQMLQLAAWLGDVSNIAMYAQTDEEITFAAEAISLRVAEEALSELLSGAASHTLGALRGSTRSGSDASVDSSGRGQGDTSPGTLLDPSNPPVRTPELGTDVNPVIDASRVSGREIETNETVDPGHREAIVPPSPSHQVDIPSSPRAHPEVSSGQSPISTALERGLILPAPEPHSGQRPAESTQEIASPPSHHTAIPLPAPGIRTIGIRGRVFTMCRNPCALFVRKLRAMADALPEGHVGRIELERLEARVVQSQRRFEQGATEEFARSRLALHRTELIEIQNAIPAVGYLAALDLDVLRAQRDVLRDSMVGQSSPVSSIGAETQEFDSMAAELATEFGASLPQGSSSRTSFRQQVAETHRLAEESGLVDQLGNPTGVDTVVAPHRRATDLRQAVGTTGATSQSAHLGATSLLRNLPGYSRGDALTRHLPPAQHQAFDHHWLAWVRLRRRQGRSGYGSTDLTVSLSAALLAQRRAIRQIQGLSQREKGALESLLAEEFYRLAAGLPNGMATRIPLPDLD